MKIEQPNLPTGADSLVYSGLRAQQAGIAEEAERCARAALALSANHRRALLLLARLLRERVDALAEYVELRGRIARLDPTSAPAWELYAWALHRANFSEQAAQAMDRVLALEPDNLAARWNRFQHPRQLIFADAAGEQEFVADWQRGLEYFEALATRPADMDNARLAEVIGSSTNFHLHYLLDDPLPLQLRYARMIEGLARHAFGSGEARNPRGQQVAHPTGAGSIRRTRPRIGFVSAHLHAHTVAKLFGALIESANRGRYEIVLVALDCEEANILPQLRGAADGVLAGRHSAAEILQGVRSLECDALIHLDIGMHPLSQVLAAFRLAPLQAMLWGHPVTSGFGAIDYFLSSDLMEPADAPARYSETLVRLPGLGCAFRRPLLAPEAIAMEPIAMEKNQSRTRYLVAQSIHKLRPDYDATLVAIAALDPRAEIVLLSHSAPHVAQLLLDRVRGQFEQAELDPQRVVQMPRLSQAQFLGLGAAADVVLDSHGWSGGNTTLELAAVGLPTLTLPGTTMRSRHSYAINRILGLDEMIAVDRTDFVQRAVALGSDRDRRLTLQREVSERTDALFDDRLVVEAFWQFIDSALQRAASGSVTA